MRALRLIAILSLFWWAASPPLRGQTPSHAQAAAELLEVMNLERTIRAAVDSVLAAEAERNPDLRDLDPGLLDLVDKHLGWEQWRAAYIRIYTDEFSEAELRELTRFYRTAAGQKVLLALPQQTFTHEESEEAAAFRRSSTGVKVLLRTPHIERRVNTFARQKLKELMHDAVDLAFEDPYGSLVEELLSLEVDTVPDGDVEVEQPRLVNEREIGNLLSKLYPDSLRKAGVSGRVVLDFIVRADGSVDESSITVASATHPGFVDPARQVITSARFEPATIQGRPFAAKVSMPITWEAEKKKPTRRAPRRGT